MNVMNGALRILAEIEIDFRIRNYYTYKLIIAL